MFGKTLTETGDNVYYIVSKIISVLPKIAKGLLDILCPKLELIKTKYIINLYQGVLENWFYN